MYYWHQMTPLVEICRNQSVEVGSSCKEEWIKRSVIWNVWKSTTRNSVEMRRRFRCLTAFELMTPLSNLISLLHRHFHSAAGFGGPGPNLNHKKNLVARTHDYMLEPSLRWSSSRKKNPLSQPGKIMMTNSKTHQTLWLCRTATDFFKHRFSSCHR